MRRRALTRVGFYRQRVVTFDGDFSFSRFEPFWRDEYFRLYRKEPPAGSIDASLWTGMPDIWRRHHRPPFWRPFNILLHCWRPEHDGEEFHDHPRWSITICLRGSLIERTPWSERVLTPGSIVIRSRKAIHGFRVLPEFRGKTWTIFIVGRRNHRQNRYAIAKQ